MKRATCVFIVTMMTASVLFTALATDVESGSYQGISVAAAPLKSACYNHTAILLTNGTVEVLGGINDLVGSIYWEVYNKAAGAWHNISTKSATFENNPAVIPLNATHVWIADNADYGFFNLSTGSVSWQPFGWKYQTRGAACVFNGATIALKNGTYAVVGGDDGYGSFKEYAVMCDPVNKKFFELGALANHPFMSGAAAQLPDGDLLVCGGTNYTDLDIQQSLRFDWSTMGWVPQGDLMLGRFGHELAVLPDGQVLAIGGWVRTGITGSCEEYDTVTGTWDIENSMNYARAGFSLTQLEDGRLVAIGGYNESSVLGSIETYSPITDSWDVVGSLQTPRAYHTATLMPDGTIWVIGGKDASGSATEKTEIITIPEEAPIILGTLNVTLTLAMPGVASGGKGNVTARVLDANGTAVAGARISNPAGQDWSGNLITDSSGIAVFTYTVDENLDSDWVESSFTVRVAAHGYNEALATCALMVAPEYPAGSGSLPENVTHTKYYSLSIREDDMNSERRESNWTIDYGSELQKVDIMGNIEQVQCLNITWESNDVWESYVNNFINIQKSYGQGIEYYDPDSHGIVYRYLPIDIYSVQLDDYGMHTMNYTETERLFYFPAQPCVDFDGMDKSSGLTVSYAELDLLSDLFEINNVPFNDTFFIIWTIKDVYIDTEVISCWLGNFTVFVINETQYDPMYGSEETGWLYVHHYSPDLGVDIMVEQYDNDGKLYSIEWLTEYNDQAAPELPTWPGEPAARTIDVAVVPDASWVMENGRTNVTVTAEMGGDPVEGAYVVVDADWPGSVSPATGYTDASGEFVTKFTGQTLNVDGVYYEVNSTVSATVTLNATGDYGTNSTEITVSDCMWFDPGLNLTIEATFTPNMLTLATQMVGVHVVDGYGIPIKGAELTFEATAGDFSPEGAATDAEGNTFLYYTAPLAYEDLDVSIVIAANWESKVLTTKNITIKVHPDSWVPPADSGRSVVERIFGDVHVRIDSMVEGNATVAVDSAAIPAGASANGTVRIFLDVILEGSGTLVWANISVSCPDWAMQYVPDESKLVLNWWNSSAQRWETPERTGVDSAGNVVWANVTHFTVFAPMWTVGYFPLGDILEIALGPFLDGDGNPVVGAVVNIVYDGKEYSAITDSEGMALFKVLMSENEDDIYISGTVVKDGEEHSFSGTVSDSGSFTPNGSIPVFTASPTEGENTSEGEGTPGEDESEGGGMSSIVILLMVVIVIAVVCVGVVVLMLRSKGQSTQPPAMYGYDPQPSAYGQPQGPYGQTQPGYAPYANPYVNSQRARATTANEGAPVNVPGLHPATGQTVGQYYPDAAVPSTDGFGQVFMVCPGCGVTAARDSKACPRCGARFGEGADSIGTTAAPAYAKTVAWPPEPTEAEHPSVDTGLDDTSTDEAPIDGFDYEIRPDPAAARAAPRHGQRRCG